jgi:hypothetical protein
MCIFMPWLHYNMHYVIINDVQTFLGFVSLLPDDDYRLAIKIGAAHTRFLKSWIYYADLGPRCIASSWSVEGNY